MTDIREQLQDALSADVSSYPLKTLIQRHQDLCEAVGRALVGMAAMPCEYNGCGDRRIHFERPDVARDTQLVEVPLRAFCSIECKMLYYGSRDPIEVLAGPSKRPEYRLEQRCTIPEFNKLPDVVVITQEDLERANEALLCPPRDQG